MLASAEIDTAATDSVRSFLRSKGFMIVHRDEDDEETTRIEAVGPTKEIVVQVCAVMGSMCPEGLSMHEIHVLKARAKETGAEAWEALVTLTPNLVPAGSVRWRRLL
jgi:hypothetical protein